MSSPYTHTQYWDRQGDESPCHVGDHHYVWDDNETYFVCTRCGDVDIDDEPNGGPE